jgi:divalent metal cation (Fe/Co/Zn/Cd) transporter
VRRVDGVVLAAFSWTVIGTYLLLGITALLVGLIIVSIILVLGQVMSQELVWKNVKLSMPNRTRCFNVRIPVRLKRRI